MPQTIGCDVDNSTRGGRLPRPISEKAGGKAPILGINADRQAIMPESAPQSRGPAMIVF
jgi:hypothetical protein